MRRLAALLLAVALTLAPQPAPAQISILGLKNSLVQFALERISVPGSFEITAEGVEEPEDGVTELVGVRIADGRGVWFEAEGIALSWRPSRILIGDLVIDRLAARGVRVSRAPETPPPDPEAEAAPEEDSAGFSWPRAPITTRIAEMRLDGVEIAPGAVFEQGLAFDATGSARDEGDEQALTLDLTRADAVEGAVRLDYLRDFAANTLRLDLTADEGAGGLAAELLSLPPEAPAEVALSADGPLSDWDVTLSADVEDTLTAEGAGAIDLGPPFALTAELVARPGARAPEAIRAALAPEARLDVEASEGADGVIRIDRADLTAPSLDASVDGTYARETGALEAEIALEARAALAALAPGVDFERVAFDGTASGALDDLRAEGALALDGLETAPADVGSARLEAVVTRAGAEIGVDLTGRAEGLRLDRLTPETVGAADLALAALYDGATLRLDRFRLDSPMLTAEASGALDPEGDGSGIDYALSAPDLAPIAAAYDVDAAGALSAEGRAEGALAAPRIAGTLSLADLAYQGEGWGQVRLAHDVTLGDAIAGTAELSAEGSPYGPAEATADFAYEGDRAALNAFTLAALGAEAEGALTYDLASGLADGAVDLRIADAAALAAQAGQSLSGRAEGRIELAAEEGAQTVRADLSGSAVEGFGASVAAFRLDATVRDALGAPTGEGVLEIDDLAAEGVAVASLAFDGRAALEGDRLGADGTLTAESLAAAGATVARLSAEIDGTDLAGPGSAADLALTAQDIAYPDAEARVASLSFEGVARDLTGAPEAEGVLTVEDIAAAGATVARVTLDARGSDLIAAPSVDGVLTAETIAHPDSDSAVAMIRLEGRGSDLLGVIDAEGTLTAEGLRAAGADADRLTAEVSGTGLAADPEATLTARIEEVAHPAAGTAWVALDAALRQQPEGAAASATLSAAPIDLADGRVGSVSAEATAVDAFGADPDIAAEIAVADLRTGGARIDRAGLTAEGALSALALALDARGALGEDRPLSLAARATVDAATPGVVEAEIARLDARLGEAEARLRRPARLRSEAGDTALEAIDLALPGGALTGAATAHADGASGDLRLVIDDVATPAGLGDVAVDGAIEFSARFDTRAASPSARLDLAARDMVFTGVSEAVGGTEPARFDLTAEGRWDGARAAATAALSGPMAQPVALEAATALRPSGGPLPTVPQGAPLSGRVRWSGRIDQFWALVPAPDHVLYGQLDLDLTLGGRLDAPTVSGDVAMSDGRYENLMLGTILTELTLASSLAEDGNFRLDLRANDGAGGPVSATAELGAGRIDAAIRSTEAVLVRRDDATAAVSLGIDADGSIDQGLDVTGTVTIDRAEIRLVNDTPPSVADLGEVRIKGEDPPEEAESAGAAVALDLRIEAEDDVFVRGRGLDSEWRIGLDVDGTAADPRVTGSIERLRGVLNLVGFPFDLERGEIRFRGESPIDPALDIALTRENDGVVGGVFVEGYASAPEVHFRSRPTLPESEVLPRILFGKSEQGLTAGEALQLAAGLAVLLDGGGDFGLGALRSATGLDVMRLEMEGEEASAVLGSNVTEKVFVGVKQPIGGGSARIQVEVDVFENLSVDSEIGQESGTSFGLNWKKDF